MTWWIAGAVVGFGLFVLFLAGLRLLGGLRELAYANRALMVRADQAKQLEEPIAVLQRQAEAMQEQLTVIAAKIEERQIRKAAEGE